MMTVPLPRDVILYSTTRHAWEVWRRGVVVGEGSLESCRRFAPDAPEPSEMQHRLAREDRP